MRFLVYKTFNIVYNKPTQYLLSKISFQTQKSTKFYIRLHETDNVYAFTVNIIDWESGEYVETEN